MPSCFFFFNDTATTEIYTLSLHDALPICERRTSKSHRPAGRVGRCRELCPEPGRRCDSLSRLLFSYLDAPGQEWLRRCDELSGEWQNDRGLRICGLPGGVQIVGRDDVHR